MRAPWVALIAFGIGASACATEETPVTAEVVITPSARSIAPGTTLTLQASAFDRNGNPRLGRSVTWSSRTPAIATVGARSGVVTAIWPGSAEIMATIDGVSGTALITVAYPEPQVRSIRVEPATAELRTGDSRTFTAVALDAMGNPIPNRTATWETSAPEVATLSGPGVVTAVSAGRATIIARIDDQAGVAIVEVSPRTASIEVSGTNVLDEAADTVQLSAVIKDRDGVVLAGWQVRWSSSDPTVAKVDAFGRVSSVRAGTVTISATSEQTVTVHQMTVTRLPVAQVALPLLVSLPRNRAVQLQARATAADGRVLRGRAATWTSSHPAVATLDDTGLLTTFTPGTTTLTVTVEGESASVSVVVQDPAAATISMGSMHSCSISATGRVHCWGYRPAAGQGADICIDVTYYDQPFPCIRTPTSLTGGGALISVVAGAWHSCGLTAAGAAWCWGANWNGQLGSGDQQREDPVQVPGGHAFVSLAAGGNFSCGLKATGEAWCWGGNHAGQLGVGNTLPSSGAVQVGGGYQFAQLSAGSAHVCGLTLTGGLYCWGENDSGQLGVGILSRRLTPTAVITAESFVQVDAGASHTCALTVSGTAWCWGEGTFGELGDDNILRRTTPVLVSGGHQWASIDAGFATTCGVRIDGAGFCWGGNWSGGVGDGTRSLRAKPALVAGSVSFVEIRPGGGHSCGRAASGALYCWGWGMAGALGLGPEVRDQLVPAQTLGNP